MPKDSMPTKIFILHEYILTKYILYIFRFLFYEKKEASAWVCFLLLNIGASFKHTLVNKHTRERQRIQHT